MRTESNAMFLINTQQQSNHLHQPIQHQQSHVNHSSQEHPFTEQYQQQIFINSPSTTMEVATSINEGLYVPATQQNLTSECLPQYYSCAKTHAYPTTSSSSSSCSSSSSDESNYSYSKQSANKKNNGKQATSIGVNLRVTGQCSQGGRKYMEDYFSVAYQQSDNAKDLEYAFIGIYDGHGGAEAAKFAKEHLMMEIINQRLFWSENDHDVLRAIREGYIATHYSMWREQDKWPKTANGLPSTAGTTATVAFIRREKIYIGHVGDSGIVLGYQNENEHFWRAKQLTTDHKPESAEERTRIMNSGGKVVVKSGVPRVVWNRPRNASHRGPIRKKTLIDEIPFLAVARSLGDLWSYNSERNEFVVSPDPDVRVIPINPNTFRCLIFGTDGLWNVVSAQEAVNTVREKEVINERLLAQKGDISSNGNQWTNPSKSLVEQALQTWSHKKMRADNTSVVTVILYPPGQVDHSMDNASYDEDNKALSKPSLVQHISYGLEYTEVQAEVPSHDDNTTYKEMALKYLPPEPYRNFNYYADESDTDGDDNDNEDEPDVILMEKNAADMQRNINYTHQYITPNNSNWQHNNTVGTLTTKTEVDENEDDDDDEEEEDEEDEDESDANVTKPKTSGNDRQVCMLGYQNYSHMEAEETNNATDSYINTFAESYNSILTVSQDDSIIAATGCSPSSTLSNNSNSNSSSNCQSVTPPNMHAILQEQQLYQQQCMSEEDGYSLTKLETRREQQTCKGSNRNANVSSGTTTSVQTFKIFHEPILEPQQMGVQQPTNSERFYHHQQQQQQQQFMSQVLPKPLELHSLLQQEREEEQRVAYERLQMETKLQQHQQNISSYVCLQPSTSSLAIHANQQPSAAFEYLEEESPATNGDILSANNLYLQQDESIQIHEISSSSCVEESPSKINSSEVEIVESIEILPNFNFEMCKNEEPAEEYPDFNNSLYSERNICLPPPQTASASAFPKLSKSQQKSVLSRSKCTKSKYLYSNVTNENLQRISKPKYNRCRYSPASESSANSRRGICLTPAASMTPPAATSTPSIQRQLRSTSSPCASTPNAAPVIDYGKRTLRTRNSLSKDMKAKTSLVQAALKYPQNAITRNLLRTTAANLMVAKPLHLNDLNTTPCSIRPLNKASNVHSPNRSSIKTRPEKCNSVALNGSLSQCKASKQNSSHSHLNLRSRQAASPPSLASTLSANVNTLRNPSAAKTPVIKRASLSERRILRSMHTRSSSSKGSQTPANFSKTTRTQSSGSNLAAPPPSPKLINSVAAVAAATRARTLLNAKHAAAANGTQSVVSSVFGKRTSLRSNVSTPGSNRSSLSTSSATHQTLRGRIVKKQKR